MSQLQWLASQHEVVWVCWWNIWSCRKFGYSWSSWCYGHQVVRLMMNGPAEMTGRPQMFTQWFRESQQLQPNRITTRQTLLNIGQTQRGLSGRLGSMQRRCQACCRECKRSTHLLKGRLHALSHVQRCVSLYTRARACALVCVYLNRCACEESPDSRDRKGMFANTNTSVQNQGN